jgi:hypothetical protein
MPPLRTVGLQTREMPRLSLQMPRGQNRLLSRSCQGQGIGATKSVILARFGIVVVGYSMRYVLAGLIIISAVVYYVRADVSCTRKDAAGPKIANTILIWGCAR